MSLTGGVAGVLGVLVLITVTGCAHKGLNLERQVLEGVSAQRIGAAAQLAMAKDPAMKAVLTSALSDPEPMVRRHAIYGLERIGDPASAKDIVPLLEDQDRWVRDNALRALGKLRSREVVGPLVKALEHGDVRLRVQALVALGRIGDPSTQQAIVTAMRDERLWTEAGAWSQTAMLGVVQRDFFTDRSVIPVLKWVISERERQLQDLEGMDEARIARLSFLVPHRAAQCLVKFGDAFGEDILIEGLSGDDYTQKISARVLGRIKSRKAVPGLIESLSSEWLSNRKYTVQSLGEIRDASAIPALEELLEDPDVEMRRLAAEALQKIDGAKREVDLTAPAAAIPEIAREDLETPGGKLPPQFICLGVDDCCDIDGLEAILDICETLQEHGSKAVFTLWVAPLAGDYENRDLEKQKLLLQRLFDMGCEIAHHTLHHNPGGRNWSSLPREQQIEEIEGCTTWYRENIRGFTRPFTHKHGGGGRGERSDPDFTRQLIARQNFFYRGRRGQHPNEQMWPPAESDYYRIQTGCLDGNAPPVHAEITNKIAGDYPGKFDYEVEDGVAMWKANFEYHYDHPRRPILGINAFHDWGMKGSESGGVRPSHRNEGKILKEFLMDVLVKNRDKYPDTHCITYRQVIEYVRTEGDLEQTLAIGNGQDSRNPVKPSIE